jgi:hypothetical protein
MVHLRLAGVRVIGLATAGDDAALRGLLAAGVMDGEAALSLEREPSFFAAAALEGEDHQTVVARHPVLGIQAMASRAVRARYLGGHPQGVAYLGGFRSHRRPGLDLLRRGFDALRSPAALHFASIVAGNDAARRLLCRGLPGLPLWTPLTPFHTFCLATRRGRTEAAAAPPRAILDCLDRNARRFPLAPCWRSLEAPGLVPDDFVAIRSGDRVIGCCAVWDQRPLRQSRVHTYRGPLRFVRPILGWLGAPRLPAPGRILPFGYLSHLYADGDDPAIARPLVDAALSRARARGLDALLWGAAPAHPLYPEMARRRGFRYDSILYAVSWNDDIPALDGIIHPEVATL